MLITENRKNNKDKALVVVATGEYNEYIKSLYYSAKLYFPCHLYIFTDIPEEYEGLEDTTIIQIPHLGWPKMPLLRFDLLYKHREIFKESYVFLIDSEARFVKHIGNTICDHRVGVLHRNITRTRQEFNYEKRQESTAYISSEEGEKYYACGLVGGKRKEFIKMAEIISGNIKADINNDIRAIWGDESHLNRYFVDNPPTLILPPNYMCPETNGIFIPYIIHQDKKFKRVNKEDTEKFTKINKNDYEISW